MKKYLTLMVCLFIIYMNVKAQDIIRKTNGDSLNCKITKIDTSNIYFVYRINDRRIETYISKDKILNYQINYFLEKKTSNTGRSKNDFLLLSFDPLGFVTMGPAVCGEILLQSKNSSVGFGLYSGIRITNLGIASNSMLAGGSMDFSYAVPIAFRLYPKARNKSDGFFIGPHVEFGRSTSTSGRKNKIRAFGGEIGYKWVYQNGFTFEISDAIGLIQVKDLPYTYSVGSFSYTESGSDWESIAFVPYMLSLKLGYTFH